MSLEGPVELGRVNDVGRRQVTRLHDRNQSLVDDLPKLIAGGIRGEQLVEHILFVGVGQRRLPDIKSLVVDGLELRQLRNTLLNLGRVGCPGKLLGREVSLDEVRRRGQHVGHKVLRLDNLIVRGSSHLHRVESSDADERDDGESQQRHQYNDRHSGSDFEIAEHAGRLSTSTSITQYFPHLVFRKPPEER